MQATNTEIDFLFVAKNDYCTITDVTKGKVSFHFAISSDHCGLGGFFFGTAGHKNRGVNSWLIDCPEGTRNVNSFLFQTRKLSEQFPETSQPLTRRPDLLKSCSTESTLYSSCFCYGGPFRFWTKMPRLVQWEPSITYGSNTIEHSWQHPTLMVEIRLRLISIANVTQVNLSHILNLRSCVIQQRDQGCQLLLLSFAYNTWMANKTSGLGRGNKSLKAYWDCVLSLTFLPFGIKAGRVCQRYQTWAKWT